MFLSRIFALKFKDSCNSVRIITLEWRRHCIPIMAVTGKSVAIELVRSMMTGHIKCRIRGWESPLNHAFSFSQIRVLRKYARLDVSIENIDGHNAVKP